FRSLQGYRDEAIQIMKEAFEASDPADVEDHAWYLTQLGIMSFDSGKTGDAESYFKQSLEIYPSSYNALAGLAKVKYAKGNADEAIKLYQKAMDIVPMPEFAASLGDIYTAQNRMEEAAKQYELVEYIGLLSELNQEIYNRQIAMFFADHDRKLDEALRLVQNEIKIRKDVYGYDALAWCLYKNGKTKEALNAMQKALSMKTKDAKLFYHAGMIYAAANQNVKAVSFLKKALDLQPHFHPIYSIKARNFIQFSLLALSQPSPEDSVHTTQDNVRTDPSHSMVN
ncbi:MAG TPA: tetratricopeptide repeat protein, partial [Acidobacteriota bacterium]|nr:tetratricopeptide repeat protein [Acidobacteriota bacterium]